MSLCTALFFLAHDNDLASDMFSIPEMHSLGIVFKHSIQDLWVTERHHLRIVDLKGNLDKVGLLPCVHTQAGFFHFVQ